MKFPIFVCAFLAITLTCFAEIVDAQVLQIPKQSTVAQPIEVEGTVVERKKYSFVVQSGNKTYTVKVANQSPISLRLHKPIFELAKSKVWVQPKPVLKPADAKPDVKRKSFALPQRLFIQAAFEHERQKNRLMSAPTKRLNNYRLSSKPFADTDNALLANGEVKLADDKKTLQLIVGEKSDPLILGQHSAVLSGFNISSLAPNQTNIKLKGLLDGDTVTATQVEFWPIANKTK